jgi:hypothetical protein
MPRFYKIKNGNFVEDTLGFQMEYRLPDWQLPHKIIGQNSPTDPTARPSASTGAWHWEMEEAD